MSKTKRIVKKNVKKLQKLPNLSKIHIRQFFQKLSNLTKIVGLKKDKQLLNKINNCQFLSKFSTLSEMVPIVIIVQNNPKVQNVW